MEDKVRTIMHVDTYKAKKLVDVKITSKNSEIFFKGQTRIYRVEEGAKMKSQGSDNLFNEIIGTNLSKLEKEMFI